MKIPNYVDDVQDFEQFDDEAGAITYAETAAPMKEEDEIENVLGHCRDEGHENDPEDDWYTNIVRPLSHICACFSTTCRGTAFPHQMEEFLPPTQHRRSVRVPEAVQRPQTR